MHVFVMAVLELQGDDHCILGLQTSSPKENIIFGVYCSNLCDQLSIAVVKTAR